MWWLVCGMIGLDRVVVVWCCVAVCAAKGTIALIHHRSFFVSFFFSLIIPHLCSVLQYLTVPRSISQ